MPRGNRASRVDANQRAIVLALRQAGFRVHSTHMVGSGFPDLVAARDGVNHLIECKDKGGRLTEDEKKFHEVWPTQIYILRTTDEVAEFSQRVRLPFAEVGE